jgi:hypothetical protein
MLRKLQVAVIVFCMLSYAEAGTVSIGTASVRGEMRVDSYAVRGDATLFEGSSIETGQATASLRLAKGTQITMATRSRGTLYSDHIVLQQGETELVPSKSFELQASGIRVTPNEPNSRGIVSVKPDSTVEVASLNGSFGVTTDRGIMLANIKPGTSFTFAMQAGANNELFSGAGLVTFENGTYYLVTDANVRYVLACKDSSKFVGDKVVVTGTMQGPNTICVKSMDINAPTTMSKKKKWIIAGIIMGGGVAAGIALSLTNQGPAPASK